MSDTTVPADAGAATTREEWLRLIAAIGAEEGYFENLGVHHWASFSDDGPILLVSFESLEDIRSRTAAQMPLGHQIATSRGWSSLCLIAEGQTWYRDQGVWGYFDRLVDDAFFENYDRVVFYGAGMGGYAACAFSVTAPGATVLAIRPRATLLPAIAGWDNRDRAARRLDFTSRYGYGPDMIDGTGRVFLLVDPAETLDASHAALYRKPHVTELRARLLGPEPEAALANMEVLEPLIAAACDGSLTAARWNEMWRNRQVYGPWLRAMLSRLYQGRSRLREALFCRAVLGRISAPRFRRRLNELEATLADQGISLPDPLPERD